MANRLNLEVLLDLLLKPGKIDTAPLEAAVKKAMGAAGADQLTLTPHFAIPKGDLSAAAQQVAAAVATGAQRGAASAGASLTAAVSTAAAPASTTAQLQSEIARLRAIGSSVGFRGQRSEEDLSHIQRYLQDLPGHFGAASQKKGAPDPRYTRLITDYIRRREEQLKGDVPISEVFSAAQQISQLPAKYLGGPEGKAGSRRRLAYEQTLTALTAPVESYPVEAVQTPVQRELRGARTRIDAAASTLARDQFDKKFAANLGSRAEAMEGLLQLEQLFFDKKIPKLPPELQRKFKEWQAGQRGPAGFTAAERKALADYEPVRVQLEKELVAQAKTTSGQPRRTQPTGKFRDETVAAELERDQAAEQVRQIEADIARRNALLQQARARQNQLKAVKKAKRTPMEEEQISVLETGIRLRESERLSLESTLTKAISDREAASAKYEELLTKGGLAKRDEVRIAPQGQRLVNQMLRDTKDLGKLATELKAPGLDRISDGFDRVEKSAQQAYVATRRAALALKPLGGQETKAEQADRLQAALEARRQLTQARRGRIGVEPERVLREIEGEQKRRTAQAADLGTYQAGAAVISEAQRRTAALGPAADPFRQIAGDATKAKLATDYLSASLRILKQEQLAVSKGPLVGPEKERVLASLGRQIDSTREKLDRLKAAQATVAAEKPLRSYTGLLSQVPKVSATDARTTASNTATLIRGLRQTREQLLKQRDDMTAAGKTGTYAFQGLTDQLELVRAGLRATTAETRAFKKALREGEVKTSGQVSLFRQRQAGIVAASGAQVRDPELARLMYGERVVEQAGGAKAVSRSAGTIHRREDLPYAMDYLAARQATLKTETDLALASSNGSKQSQQHVAALQKQTQQYGDALRSARQQLLGHNEAMKQAGNLIKMFLRYSVGYAAFYRVLYGIQNLVSGVVDFDRVLKSIQAVSQATDAEMLTLETSIKRVATTTMFTAQEVGKAAQIIAQAGVEVKDFPNVLEGVALFASATESSLETAADLVTTMRTVFSDMEGTAIANQLTRAVNISKLTADDLKTILSLGAQMSKAYGLSSEQFLAAATTLKNAGIKASTVATGLRQAMIEIFSPDEKTLGILSKRYKELGEKRSPEQIRARFFGFSQEEKPLVAAIGELRRLGYSGSGQGTFQRTYDVRAENAIKGLITQFEELQAAESKITFGNAAAEGAATQMEALANSLKNLGAALGAVSHDFARDLLPQLDDVVDTLTGMVTKLRDANDEMRLASGSGYGSTVGSGALAGLAAFKWARPGTPLPMKALGAATAALGGGVAAGWGKGKAVEAGAGETGQDIAQLASALAFAAALMRGPGAIRNIGAKAADRVRGTQPSTSLANFNANKWTVEPKDTVIVAAASSWNAVKKGVTGFFGKLLNLGKMMGAFNWVGLTLIVADFLGVFEWVGKTVKGWAGIVGKTPEQQRYAKALTRSEDATRRSQRLMEDAETQRQAVERTRPTNLDQGYAAPEQSTPRNIEKFVLEAENADKFLAARAKTAVEREQLRALLERVASTNYDVGDKSKFPVDLEKARKILGEKLTSVTLSALAAQFDEVKTAASGLISSAVPDFQRLSEQQKEGEIGQVDAERLLAYKAAAVNLPEVQAAFETGDASRLDTKQVQTFFERYVAILVAYDKEFWNKFYEGSEAVDKALAVQAEAALAPEFDPGKRVSGLLGLKATQTKSRAELIDEAYAKESERLRKAAGTRAPVVSPWEVPSETRSGFGALAAQQSLGMDKETKEALAKVEDELKAIKANAETAKKQIIDSYNSEVDRVYTQAQAALKEFEQAIAQDADLRKLLDEQKTAGEDGGPTPLYNMLSKFFTEDWKLKDNGENVVEAIRKEGEAQVEKLRRILEVLEQTRAQPPTPERQERIAGLQADLAAGQAAADEIAGRKAAAQVATGAVQVTAVPDQKGEFVVAPNPEQVKARQSLENAQAKVAQEREAEGPDVYVEGAYERMLRDRIFEMELLIEQYKDQRKWGRVLGATQEKYRKQIELATIQMREAEKARDKAAEEGKERPLQAAENTLRDKRVEIQRLQAEMDQASYGLQMDSVADTREELDKRLKQLQTLLADQLATPTFTDWDQFTSLQQQYQEVLAKLVAVIQAEGELRGKSQLAIQQDIDTLMASSSSLQALTKAFDESVQFLAEFRASYAKLTDPGFISSGTNKQLAIKRADYGIREPVDSRLESLRAQETKYTSDLEVLADKQDKAITSLSDKTKTEKERGEASASLARIQDEIQSTMQALIDVREATRAASLDIHGELAEGFNAAGIMDDLREQVEGTIGNLGETIRETFSTFFEDVSDTLVDAAFGDIEGSLGDALDGVAKNFGKSLAKAILKSYLDKTIFSLLRRVMPQTEEDKQRLRQQSVTDKLNDFLTKPVTAGTVQIQAGTVNISGDFGKGLKPVAPPYAKPSAENLAKAKETLASATFSPSVTKDEVNRIIEETAPGFGLDPALVKAVVQTESSYDPKAVSPAGAQGLMQLMPGTAERFGVKNAYDPAQNLRGGMEYLAWLLERFNGNVELALAGYNAGEGAVDKYGGKIPPYPETEAYVKKVLAIRGGAPVPEAAVASTAPAPVEEKAAPAAEPAVAKAPEIAPPPVAAAAPAPAPAPTPVTVVEDRTPPPPAESLAAYPVEGLNELPQLTAKLDSLEGQLQRLQNADKTPENTAEVQRLTTEIAALRERLASISGMGEETPVAGPAGVAPAAPTPLTSVPATPAPLVTEPQGISAQQATVSAPQAQVSAQQTQLLASAVTATANTATTNTGSATVLAGQVTVMGGGGAPPSPGGGEEGGTVPGEGSTGSGKEAAKVNEQTTESTGELGKAQTETAKSAWSVNTAFSGLSKAWSQVSGFLGGDVTGPVNTALSGIGLVSKLLGAVVGLRSGGIVGRSAPKRMAYIRAAAGKVLGESDKQEGSAVVKHFQSEQTTLKDKVLEQLGITKEEVEVAEAEVEGRPVSDKERREGALGAASGRVMEAGVRLKSGMIKGIGTSTSDSVPGVVVDNGGKVQSGIKVSTGEAVLKAKAVTKLGAPFINWVNANAERLAEGGIIGSPSISNLVPVDFGQPMMKASRNGITPLFEKVARAVDVKAAAVGGPSTMRLEVSAGALNRRLKDYLEDYFADVVAGR